MNIVILPGETEKKIQVKEDSIFLLFLKKKQELIVEFRKAGVRVKLICLVKLAENEKALLHTETRHFAEKTHCHTEVYASLANASNFEYFGKIFIAAKAKNTESYLNQKDLILGEKAQSSSQPILEIKNEQVQASHSSSTGKIDQEALFYLKSRGMNQEEAQSILEEAFFMAVLKKIPDEKAILQAKKYLDIKE